MEDIVTGRNIEFPIYTGNDVPFHNLVLRKATVESVVMSLGDKITGDLYYKDNSLVFTMQEYVKYKGVKYYLVSPPTIVREGLVSDNGDAKGMTKYTFTFYHPMYMLGNFPFTDIAVDAAQSKYLSESKTFAWTGNLFDFIAKLNANLAGTEWVIENNIQEYETGTSTHTKDWDKADKVCEEPLTFDKNYISDALKTAYDTWEIPFVVSKVAVGTQDYTQGKRFKVSFGLPTEEILDANNQPFVFQFGQGVGLKNDSRTPRNNKIVTRIVGVGAERNVPWGYPQIPWYGIGVKAKWDYTINNDPNDPHSYPIYTGIVSGQPTRLIKHPFTRKTLMPTVYVETLFNKVSPYIQGGNNNTNYDPDTVLVDYYDAIDDASHAYPNNINPSAPSVETHQFEKVYPRLPEAHINNVQPYEEIYKLYLDWRAEIDDIIANLDNQGERGYEKTLLDYVRLFAAPYTEQYVEQHPTVKVNPLAKQTIRTGSCSATLEVITYDNYYIVNVVSTWLNGSFKVYQPNVTPTPVWDDSYNIDEDKYNQPYFKLTLPALGFDLYACAAVTEEMKINMRSGACMGCTFPVQVDWDDYKKNFYTVDGDFAPSGSQRDYTTYPDSTNEPITVIVQKDIDTYGTIMPDTYRQVRGVERDAQQQVTYAGDTFVILGISLPQTYIATAQFELDEEAKQYMLENNVHYFDYPLKFDEHFLATHTNILSQIDNNKALRFLYAGENMVLYIKQIVTKYGEGVLPKYDITVTDDVEVVLNSIGQVTDDVSRMRVQVSELQKYYAGNLITEIQNRLSRVMDDVCEGRITFQQGLDSIGNIVLSGNIQTPNFTEGLENGTGWRIDDLGNAEVQSIRVRTYLEVIQLLVNRMQGMEGDTVFTDNDQIERVDSVHGSNQYILALKEKYEGYVTAQKTGNILKGIINTLAAENSDIAHPTDGQGQLYTGEYYTSYMKVIGYNGDTPSLGINQIKVELYADEETPAQRNFAPCELMAVARIGCYQSPTESGISSDVKADRIRRQTSFYISGTEGRIVKLVAVDKPILENHNYGVTIGILPDFVKDYANVRNRIDAGRDYLYAQGVVVQDFIKIDGNGHTLPTIVRRDEKFEDIVAARGTEQGVVHCNSYNGSTMRYETDQIYHENALWEAKVAQPIDVLGYVAPSITKQQFWKLVTVDNVVNPNLLLQPTFDNNIDVIKKAWTRGDYTKISIDNVHVIQGRNSIKIDATTLTGNDYKDFGQSVGKLLQPSTWYTLSFYENYEDDGSNPATNQKFGVFLYANYAKTQAKLYDDTQPFVVDGELYTPQGNNGYIELTHTTANNKHTVTFKTAASIPEVSQIFFRARATYALFVCMPKLEIGMYATAFNSNRGEIGRFYYYAGVWVDDSSTSKTVSDTQVPYFKYGNNYYVFKPTTNGTYTLAEMGIPNPNSNPNWELMLNDFNYIISEAIFANYAHFGGAIINGDWMLSQYGTVNGEESQDYIKFNPDHPTDDDVDPITNEHNFIPNFAVDLLKGKTIMNSQITRFRDIKDDYEYYESGQGLTAGWVYTVGDYSNIVTRVTTKKDDPDHPSTSLRIILPMGVSFIGRTITLFEDSLPPFTTLQAINICLEERLKNDTGYFFGLCRFSLSNLQTYYIEDELNFKGGTIELLGVPSTSNGEKCCGWLVKSENCGLLYNNGHIYEGLQ